MNVEGKYYGNKKAGAVVECLVCGKEFYKQKAFLKSKNHFCCSDHAKEYIAKSRRKASNCVVCGAEMTGNDLKQFWGKCGRDKSGKIHGMCRACKTRKDQEKKERASLQKEAARRRRLSRMWRCEQCGRTTTSKVKICRDCNPKEYNQHLHKKVMSDPKKHLNMVMRVSVRQCLKGEKKNRSTFDLVGYSVNQLKRHIEKQFSEGMTWENWGIVWHIDHIIPLSAFNFTKPEDPDFRRAWALSNIRPLWAKDNLSKSAKVEKPFQPYLAV